MDAKIEGYLVAATVLIPTGITMATTTTGTNQVIGLIMVIVGLVAIGLRGNMKEDRVKEYVDTKVNEVKQG